MTNDGTAIANFVLDRAEVAGVANSPMALQKIVYFCQLWALIELGQPLLRHSFEAWEHGPVLQYLYREFKQFGAEPIRGRAQRKPVNRAHRSGALLFQHPHGRSAEIVAIYGRMSAAVLRDLTHAPGGPWHKVWHHGGKINPCMRIDNRDIKHFHSRISQLSPLH